jgi:hypothetical protein
VPRVTVGIKPELSLVQHRVAARRADGGVRGRRVEANDRDLAPSAVSPRR